MDTGTDWQPMSRAPRDGRRFVAGLWVGGTGHFAMHIIRADGQGGGVHPDDDRGWGWADYTHCLPLPAAPADALASPTMPERTTVSSSPMERAFGVG